MPVYLEHYLNHTKRLEYSPSRLLIYLVEEAKWHQNLRFANWLHCFLLRHTIWWLTHRLSNEILVSLLLFHLRRSAQKDWK